MGELKNVVIVGAQGGALAARALEKTLPTSHRIVLIDANEFAYWPVAALRASTAAGHEDDVLASLENFFPKESRHIVLPGYKVTQILPASVKLARAAPAPFESDEIQVDVGIIATGSKYLLPCRPSSYAYNEARAGLKDLQDGVARAEHIVIVGGGPVGVEFAGEVLSIHPKKRVTLLHRDAQLLSPDLKPGLHKRLYNQLKTLNVDVQLSKDIEIDEEQLTAANRYNSEKITLKAKDGDSYETDYLFIATGGGPNVDTVPSEALDKPSKGPARIAVDPFTLQVTNKPLTERWFAVGDCNNAPGSKTFVATKAQVPIAAAQVQARVNGSVSTKGYKDPGSIMVVPLGPKGGAAQIMFFVFGQWVTSFIKGKALFVSDFKKVYST